MQIALGIFALSVLGVFTKRKWFGKSQDILLDMPEPEPRISTLMTNSELEKAWKTKKLGRNSADQANPASPLDQKV